MRAAVYHGPNKLEIADVPEPAPAPRIQGSLCYTAADFEAVIALMAQGAYDTDGWVTEIAIDDVTGRGIRGAACGHEDEGAGRSGRAMTLNGKLGLVGAVPDGIWGAVGAVV